MNDIAEHLHYFTNGICECGKTRLDFLDETLDSYLVSARAIALWTDVFCDKDLPYDEMMNCEHCTGTVLFTWGRFSITRCDWGCGHVLWEWVNRKGVTVTIAEW